MIVRDPAAGPAPIRTCGSDRTTVRRAVDAVPMIRTPDGDPMAVGQPSGGAVPVALRSAVTP
jgi:hypothetical protein